MLLFLAVFKPTVTTQLVFNGDRSFIETLVLTAAEDCTVSHPHLTVTFCEAGGHFLCYEHSFHKHLWVRFYFWCFCVCVALEIKSSTSCILTNAHLPHTLSCLTYFNCI